MFFILHQKNEVFYNTIYLFCNFLKNYCKTSMIINCPNYYTINNQTYLVFEILCFKYFNHDYL